MTALLLSREARRFIGQMTAALAPQADRLDRRMRATLRERGYGAAESRAFLAITPVAASRVANLPRFLEQVEYNGRRLAKLNVEPAQVEETLQSFGPVLAAALGGQWEPAREQLYLATVFTLRDAFFQVREAETQTFFGLHRAEIAAEGLDDLLQRFVRILVRTFRARAARLLVLESRPAAALRRPRYIERGQGRENLIVDRTMRGRFASYWSFPMGECAVLQLGFDVRYPWLPRERALLMAVGDRCRQAIERARAEEEIRRLEAEARRAEEEERRRIGRELHDEAGQSLLALRLQLEMMERGTIGETRAGIAQARGVVEHAVSELRRIVAALGPAVLERLGLEAALRQLAARFAKMHGAPVRLRIAGGRAEMPRQAQETIYRIAQESLQNAVKHSRATRVNLLLQTTDKKIRLSVSDNGVGFAKQAALSKPMSFGLAGMRERAVLLGGELTVRSAPGKGVKVVLELPQAFTPGT